jgi:polar amino acid transport system substrate-binding protein
MSIPATLISAFALTGKVRASINLGTPILAGRDAAGAPCGVSVDLQESSPPGWGAALNWLLLMPPANR